MYKDVKISRVDGSKAPTPMLANAATPRRFKQVFGGDLITLFANVECEENGRTLYNMDFLGQLAFIMAMQAEAHKGTGKKLEMLNENDFIDWLENYDGMAIENAAEDIIDVYLGTTKISSEVKKNRGGQKES